METSLEAQWLRPRLPMQGLWVPSLLRELRSHVPPGQKHQNIKQKQYCNKFYKDFKHGPLKKKIFKKVSIQPVKSLVKLIVLVFKFLRC